MCDFEKNEILFTKNIISKGNWTKISNSFQNYI